MKFIQNVTLLLSIILIALVTLSECQQDICIQYGCSHDCIPIDRQSSSSVNYTCTCPQDLILSTNQKTCIEQEILLTTHSTSDSHPHKYQLHYHGNFHFPTTNQTDSAISNQMDTPTFSIVGSATGFILCQTKYSGHIICTDSSQNTKQIPDSSLSKSKPVLLQDPQGDLIFWNQDQPGCFRVYSLKLNASLDFQCFNLDNVSANAMAFDFRRRCLLWCNNQDQTVMFKFLNVPAWKVHTRFSGGNCSGIGWDEQEFRLFLLIGRHVLQADHHGSSHWSYHQTFKTLRTLDYDGARQLLYYNHALFWIGGGDPSGEFIDLLVLARPAYFGQPLAYRRIFQSQAGASIASFHPYELTRFLKTWTLPCDNMQCSHFCTTNQDNNLREPLGDFYGASCQCPRGLKLQNLKVCVVPDNKVMAYIITGVCLLSLGILIGLVLGIMHLRKCREVKRLQKTIHLLIQGQPAAQSTETQKTRDNFHNLPLNSIIPRDSLSVSSSKVLGKGHFGIVKEGIFHGESVAVKSLKPVRDLKTIADFLSELKLMEYVGDHENIVRFLGAEISGVLRGEIYAILELSPYGSLDNYLLENRKYFLPSIDLWSPQYHNNSNIKNQGTLAQGRYSDYPNLQDPIQPSDGVNCKSSYANFPEHGRFNSQNQQNHTQTSLRLYDNSPTSESIVNYSNMEASQPPLLREHPGRTGNQAATKIFPSSKPTDMDGAALSNSIFMQWASQIARGMAFLEAKCVVHGDLAARNILVFPSNVVKISDFGFSKNLYQQSEYLKKQNTALPWRWASPETLTRLEFSSKSDVWSFGVTLWEIFSLGKVPFPQYEWTDEFVSYLQKGMRLLKPENMTMQIYNEILLKTWNLDPDERPNFRELLHQISLLQQH